MSVRDVEWGEPLLPLVRDPALEAEARKGGRVQGSSGYFSAVPWVYLGMVRLNQRLTHRVALEHDLADLAGLVVSQDNSCRYCYAVQRALQHINQMTADRLLTPVIDKVFAFEDFVAAHHYMETCPNRGRVALELAAD